MNFSSSIRSYRPPAGTYQKFLQSKKDINSHQTQTMMISVESYLEKLKESRKPVEEQINPRQLSYNEIPTELESPWFRVVAPTVPSKIKKAYDQTNYYKSKQQPLQSVLPNLFITRQFQNYIEENHERMPCILESTQLTPKPKRSPRFKTVNRIPPFS